MTASRPTSLTTQVGSDDQKFSQRPRRAFWLRTDGGRRVVCAVHHPSTAEWVWIHKSTALCRCLGLESSVGASAYPQILSESHKIRHEGSRPEDFSSAPFTAGQHCPACPKSGQDRTNNKLQAQKTNLGADITSSKTNLGADITRQRARAVAYSTANARLRSSASIRAHLLRVATRGRRFRRGSQLAG